MSSAVLSPDVGLPVDVAELYSLFQCTPQEPIRVLDDSSSSNKYRVRFKYKKGKKGVQSAQQRRFHTRKDAIQYVREFLNQLATQVQQLEQQQDNAVGAAAPVTLGGSAKVVPVTDDVVATPGKRREHATP